MNPQQIAQIVQNEINKGLSKINDKTFYRGIVTAATGNKANVRLEGATNPVTNILCLSSYQPKVGDQVFVVSVGASGANYLVLGKTDIAYTPPPVESEHLLRMFGTYAFTIPSAYFAVIPYAVKSIDESNIYNSNQIIVPEAGLYYLAAGIRVTTGTPGSLRIIYEMSVFDEDDNFNQELTRRIQDMVTGGTTRSQNAPAVALGSTEMMLPKNYRVRPRIWQNIEGLWTVEAQHGFGDTYLNLRKSRSMQLVNLISNGAIFNYIDTLFRQDIISGTTLTVDTSIFSSSPNSMRVAHSGTSKTVLYSVAIRSGRKYRLKFRVRSSVASANCSPYYSNAAGASAIALPTLALTSGAWTTYETEFTASANRTRLGLRVQMTGGFANFDDIELYEL